MNRLRRYPPDFADFYRVYLRLRGAAEGLRKVRLTLFVTKYYKPRSLNGRHDRA
jgi:hypothetical protein